MLGQDILEKFRIVPGTKVRLRDHDPGWAQTKTLKEQGKDATREQAEVLLEENRQELSEAQRLLYADNRYSLLIILQAMDAAGKDGTIRHVMSGVNPQGCQVFSFKAPSGEELDHDFLWRCNKRLPERGR
ncbi:MAG: polyphosphate kinase 2 family protein, partial [Planctomycetaceae bacterium]|nr:polyphosphate kinase 2 family protein [Planctomycetaceae bacterium]